VARRPWAKLAGPSGVWLEPPPDSLLASAKSTGKPAMLISTPSGLWLQAWDDPWRRQLTSTRAMQALYDPRTAIVLYTADDQLWALDLAASVADGELPTPASLAKDAVAKNDAWLELALEHQDGNRVASSPWPGDSHFHLVWGARPTLTETCPIYPPDDCEPTRRQIDGAWLIERNERRSWKAARPEQSVLQFAEPANEGEVADLLFTGRCPQSLCGAGLPLGASNYEWVVVGEVWGDVYHLLGLVRERAHDGADERWIDLPGFMTFIASGAGQPDFVDRPSPSPWPAPTSDHELPAAMWGPGMGYVGGDDRKPVDWHPRTRLRGKMIDELQTEEALRFDVGGELFMRSRGSSSVCSIRGGCIDYDASVLDFLAGNVDIGPSYVYSFF
jgi:hypothetical protein